MILILMFNITMSYLKYNKINQNMHKYNKILLRVIDKY